MNTERRAKIAFSALFVIAVLCGLVMLALAATFEQAPTSPNPQTGQIVEYRNHSDRHYVTAGAYRIFTLAQIGGIAAVFMAVVAARALRKKR